MESQKAVYHTKVPMDKLTRTAFIPHIFLDMRSPEEQKALVALALQKSVSDLLALDVQPYIMVDECVTRQKGEDGVEREGKLFRVSILVGKKPLITGADGKSMFDDNGITKLITVGNN